MEVCAVDNQRQQNFDEISQEFHGHAGHGFCCLTSCGSPNFWLESEGLEHYGTWIEKNTLHILNNQRLRGELNLIGMSRSKRKRVLKVRYKNKATTVKPCFLDRLVKCGELYWNHW